jgi:ABC-type enterochelin transport system ATPase subunit
MTAVFELKNLYKRFGDNVIYEDMNLEVEEGETFSIIGGSRHGQERVPQADDRAAAVREAGTSCSRARRSAT